jgi:hypothetical protein
MSDPREDESRKEDTYECKDIGRGRRRGEVGEIVVLLAHFGRKMEVDMVTWDQLACG